MKRAVEIALPIHTVVALFMDKDNLKAWRKVVVDYEPVRGTPGTLGAVTLLQLNRTALVETIVFENLPHEITFDIEHQKSKLIHRVNYCFTPLSENSTSMEATVTIQQYAGVFSWIFIQLVMLTGSSGRYYQSLLNQFKSFAEAKG